MESTEKTARAAVYCRLSKEDAGKAEGEDSESIRNQKSMLLEYAAARGYEVRRVYSDDDRSGADRERPGFRALLADAERGEFDIVLAKTQSRFTRDMEMVEKYLHGKFAEWGVRFIAVVDHADTDDRANKKTRQINGLVNEWYLEDLSENVRSVLTHKRREGKYIAAFALYGYRKDDEDKNRLRIDPAAAQTVRRIFSMYLAGSGAAKIAQKLNEEKIPAPLAYRQGGGALWGRATVYKMLRNRTYAGDLVQGRRRKLSYKSSRSIELPRSEWITVPGTHEPIVPPETFDSVQRMLDGKRRSCAAGTIRPLSGKVRCAHCGSRMETTGSARRPYLRCALSQRSRSACPVRSCIPLEALERLVSERMRRCLEACPGLGAAAERAAAQAYADAGRAEEEQLRALRRDARRIEEALRKSYLDSPDEGDTSGLFAAGRAIRARLEVLERKTIASRSALERTVREALAPGRPPRALVCLLIREITVSPPDERGVRHVAVHWLF